MWLFVIGFICGGIFVLFGLFFIGYCMLRYFEYEQDEYVADNWMDNGPQSADEIKSAFRISEIGPGVKVGSFSKEFCDNMTDRSGESFDGINS